MSCGDVHLVLAWVLVLVSPSALLWLSPDQYPRACDVARHSSSTTVTVFGSRTCCEFDSLPPKSSPGHCVLSSLIAFATIITQVDWTFARGGEGWHQQHRRPQLFGGTAGGWVCVGGWAVAVHLRSHVTTVLLCYITLVEGQLYRCRCCYCCSLLLLLLLLLSLLLSLLSLFSLSLLSLLLWTDSFSFWLYSTVAICF